MQRKVFKTGNSLVVSLPREIIEPLGVSDGSDVSVELDRVHGQILIRPARMSAAGVDETFARQVSEFISEYRPALDALSKK